MGEALKLVSPFKGDKREVLAFISKFDTVFEIINPEIQMYCTNLCSRESVVNRGSL